MIGNKTVDKWFGRRLILYTFLIVMGLMARTYAAGIEVGSFTAPLQVSWGGTGLTSYTTGQVVYASGASTLAGLSDVATGQVLASGGTSTAPAYTATPTVTSVACSGNTAAAFTYSNGTKVVASTAATSDGDLLIGSTSAGPTKAQLSAGTGITITPGSGTITIAATGGTNKTITAKTAGYNVLSGDSQTVFTNTGASGSVTFTLPTASAGLEYFFYIDAVQTVVVTAPASTTIRLGGTASATAGNVTAGAAGNMVHIIAISSTQYVTLGYNGTWTVN